MGRARIEVWNANASTKLADAFTVDPNLQQRNFDQLQPTGKKYGESGSAGFVLQRDHPAAAHCVPGNVVRLVSTTGGTPLAQFTIDEVSTVDRAVKQIDEVVTVSALDMLERFEAASVRPQLPGDNARPVSPDRVWNFATPTFNDSGWSTVSYAQTRVVSPSWPEAYPMAPTYAGMLWSAPHSLTHPAGRVLWRRSFTLSSQKTIAMFHSADDAADPWADGVSLNRHNVVYPSTDGWQKTWREVPTFSPGPHVVAYEAHNLAVGAAYFMASLFEVNGDRLGDPVASTGDGLWRWYDPGSGDNPGFTAPQIMQQLLDEEQAAGGLAGWTIQTHGVHVNIPEFAVRVGTTYREVIALLQASWADIAADTTTLTLHMWPKDGMRHVVAVNIPAAAIREKETVATADVYTRAMGVHSDGVVTRTRSAHPRVGHRTKTLQLGQWNDTAAVRQVLDRFLDAWANPTPAIVADLRDLPGIEAGVDYDVGSLLKLDGVDVVCTGIAWIADQWTGELIPTPEFDSLVSVRRREFELTQERMARQFESPASAPLLSSERLLMSGHPSTGSFTWSWADDIEDALNEVDPEKPWQLKNVETISRCWKVEVEIDPNDLGDAWGTTTVQLMRAGVEWNPLFRVQLTTSVAKASAAMFGYSVVTPAQRLQPRVTAAGGHVDGTYTLHYAEAV